MGSKTTKEKTEDEHEFIYKNYELEKPCVSYLGTKFYEQTPLVHTLQRPIDTKPHIDGDYLRSKFPYPNVPIKSDHIDALVLDCVTYAERKASERNLSCEYEVPLLKPPLPLYDRKEAVFALYMRLKERKNWTVYGKPGSPFSLFISWA